MVGIINTKNRELEYVPTRNGINYGNALIQELIPEIKKLNSSKHKHYSKYYCDESFEIVTNHCKKDLQYFNYKFENK